ncbi:hypothetical protein MTR_2g090300 [Medicago truncatula]|uniref:Uncharacterized protein n=1 Tax=Medicago truncatula TaxID=3880 RepID=A0A072VAR3_MEDTR|nr:hypothetical protein MTR_2g090300 [Medicago truncatula]
MADIIEAPKDRDPTTRTIWSQKIRIRVWQIGFALLLGLDIKDSIHSSYLPKGFQYSHGDEIQERCALKATPTHIAGTIFGTTETLHLQLIFLEDEKLLLFEGYNSC